MTDADTDTDITTDADSGTDVDTDGGTAAENTDSDFGSDETSSSDAETDIAGLPARTAVLAGPDDDALGAALADRGMDIERVDGIANREALEAVGIAAASLFVLTDARQATAIPVAKDVNPGLRVVVYARDSLPEFARGQADLLVDPALLEPAIVAEELTA